MKNEKKQWYQKVTWWLIVPVFLIFSTRSITFALSWMIGQTIIATVYAKKFQDKGWKWYYYIVVPLSIFVSAVIVSAILFAIQMAIGINVL